MTCCNEEELDDDPFCARCKEKRDILFSIISHLGNRIRIGTLGPEGTTSYEAAKYVKDFLEKQYGDPNIVIQLYVSFDLAFNALLDGKIDMILLPNAYHKMTEFYWNSHLELLLTFTTKTPEYGIAYVPGIHTPAKDYYTIATCKAVEHILFELWKTTPYSNSDFHVIDAYSTTASLNLLLSGEVDFALTNRTSLDRSHAQFISDTKQAEVLWSIFYCKGETKCRELTAVHSRQGLYGSLD